MMKSPSHAFLALYGALFFALLLLVDPTFASCPTEVTETGMIWSDTYVNFPINPRSKEDPISMNGFLRFTGTLEGKALGDHNDYRNLYVYGMTSHVGDVEQNKLNIRQTIKFGREAHTMKFVIGLEADTRQKIVYLPHTNQAEIACYIELGKEVVSSIQVLNSTIPSQLF